MISELYENEEGKFLVFPNDAITQHLKKNKVWEPHFKEVIKVLVKPGATVIDAGANFGYNSVLLGKQIGPNGTLVSFEPQRIIYQQLCGNLILNNIYNATAYQAALGDGSKGVANMKPVEYQAEWVNIGDTSIGEDGEEVAVYTLDEIGISKLDFIKMDIQGYELFALQGAQNILSIYQPDLFIEIEPHQLIKFNVTEEQLLTYIKSFGYSIYKINNEYPCDHICTINNLDKINLLQSILPLVQV